MLTKWGGLVGRNGAVVKEVVEMAEMLECCLNGVCNALARNNPTLWQNDSIGRPKE